MKHRATWALLAFGLIGAGTASGQGYREPDFKQPDNVAPSVLREVGFDQKLGDQLPLDITLRDEAGRPIELSELVRDRPVVLSLVYFECPMLCKITNAGLASAFSSLPLEVGKEFDVVTVSFDPREGPAQGAMRKREAAARYKKAEAAAKWRFLTGEQAQIDRLTQAVGFRYAWDERTKQFAHPAGVVVLTPQGKIARYMYGVEFAPRDLRLALVEASEGRIGTPVDTVLLYCYHYDPSTGRYGAVVLNIVRLAGGVTVAALAVFVGAMFLRERRRGRSDEAA